jgi:hypothetical protein
MKIQYRDLVKEWANNPTRIFDFSKGSCPKPKIGYWWGNWKFGKYDLTMKHNQYCYCVPLTDMDTPENILSWILHLVGNKIWITEQDIGNFVQAIDDILNLKANIHRPFNAQKYLREYYGKKTEQIIEKPYIQQLQKKTNKYTNPVDENAYFGTQE